MKSIRFVPDIELTDIYGDSLTAESDGRQIPIVQSHVRFMLERCGDPVFVGSRNGVDAIEFVIAARAEIRDQSADAKTRGHWLLEDDRASAHVAATLHPKDGYRPDIQHNLKPYTDAAKAMADVRDGEEKK